MVCISGHRKRQIGDKERRQGQELVIFLEFTPPKAVKSYPTWLLWPDAMMALPAQKLTSSPPLRHVFSKVGLTLSICKYMF
jgi:hypothetical protein